MLSFWRALIIFQALEALDTTELKEHFKARFAQDRIE